MSAATATPSTTAAPAAADRFSVRRLVHLTRWNLVLLARNRLALVYGTVLPLAGLLLLLPGERGDIALGASGIGGVVLTAGLFPVFYNVLSQFVNRRDELVLKRMRTGEVRDSELLVGIALPGVLCALAVCAVTVPAASALGQPLPLNAALFAVGALVSAAMFAGLAYWTAAWTRSAEAAQLTSMPVIILAIAGPILASLTSLSETVQDLVSYTPGAAISELVRVGWFGLDGTGATESTLSFSETWSQAAGPLAVMVAWTVLALALASRSMRWEPRS
ncbi:ABC transporter permease [Nocardioides sp. 1609]|uniref:ABC transporter permease n=1 Tax=Nocardioides sp. 1609 TaxID=2508327 RepID=UPI00106F9C39|nr:ABC transporter permease [Nocardioides sp. 1609]